MRLSDAECERVRNTPPDVTNARLAEELGVSERTIIRYRKQARQERREVAREVLERRVEAEMPNALEALGDALRVAREQMLDNPTPQWVRETRESAKVMLEYVGRPDEDLDAVIDGELEKLAGQSQAGPPAASARAQPFVH